MSIVYSGSEFTKQIADALGVSDTYKRIIIDIPFDGVVTIHIEMLASEDKLKITQPDFGKDIIIEKTK